LKPPHTVDLRVVPITVKAATKWVAEFHRHLPRVGGGLFACAVADTSGALRGVGIVGCGARVWQGTTKMTITRIATDGAPNACSMLYGALCRAGKALGYTEAWTYTLPEEPGASLRGAGFKCVGWSAGGEHSREGRYRAPAARPEPKQRWRRDL